MQVPQGSSFAIKGKYYSMSLTARTHQSISHPTIQQYQSFLQRVDDFFDHMWAEHQINLLCKKRPHKKIIRLFDRLTQADTDQLNLEANGILAQLESIKFGFQNIKSTNETAYRDIRKNLIRNSSSNSYYGFVFELSIASTLSMNGIDYKVLPTNDGSPDFELSINGSKYYIECRSIFTTSQEHSEEKYKAKIVQGINSKESKKYAASNCALFIDTTPIERLRKTGIVLDSTGRIPELSKFGCIALFTYFTRTQNGRVILTQDWSREYFNNLDSQFKNTLNSLIPKSEEPQLQMVDTYTDI